MPLIVYEEVGKDNILLSPEGHSIRIAFEYMGLKADFIGVKPSELKDLKLKSSIILKDGKRIIQSGFEVAKYLERNFPLSPTLFGGEAGTYLANFVNCYAEDALYPLVLCALAQDMDKHLEENEYNIYLARVILGNKSRKEYILEINKRLNPIRHTLKKQDFLYGERPGYADFIIYGIFAWAESISDITLLNRRDSMNNWKKNVSNLMVRKAA